MLQHVARTTWGARVFSCAWQADRATRGGKTRSQNPAATCGGRESVLCRAARPAAQSDHPISGNCLEANTYENRQCDCGHSLNRTAQKTSKEMCRSAAVAAAGLASKRLERSNRNCRCNAALNPSCSGTASRQPPRLVGSAGDMMRVLPNRHACGCVGGSTSRIFSPRAAGICGNAKGEMAQSVRAGHARSSVRMPLTATAGRQTAGFTQ